MSGGSRIERDAGRGAATANYRPTADERAGHRVLKHFVLHAIVDHPQVRAVCDYVLGIRVAAVEFETVDCVLTAGEAASGIGVFEDLVTLGIDDPNINAVGGDAFDSCIIGQRAGSPVAKEFATVVVDIDVAIGIDDPDLRTRRRADGTAWGRVHASNKSAKLFRC